MAAIQAKNLGDIFPPLVAQELTAKRMSKITEPSKLIRSKQRVHANEPFFDANQRIITQQSVQLNGRRVRGRFRHGGIYGQAFSRRGRSGTLNGWRIGPVGVTWFRLLSLWL